MMAECSSTSEDNISSDSSSDHTVFFNDPDGVQPYRFEPELSGSGSEDAEPTQEDARLLSTDW